MARPKNKAPSLPLFSEPMTSERAWTIVERIPVDVTVTSERQKCAGACCKAKGALGHGPYYFARFRREDGRTVRRYIGSEAKLAEVREAWRVASAEVEAARALADATMAPEAARARQLEARAQGPQRARKRPARATTVDVPILKFGGAK